MRARVPIAALAALLVAVTVAAGASAKPAPPPGQNAAPTDVRAAFFTNWSRYARGYFVKQIPADKLNVLDYAFGAPTAAGTCGLTDPWSDYEAPTGADAERRRRRRRLRESEPAPVRQLQPAAEAEGGAPEPARRDVARRLDRVEVLLRRRGHRGDAPGVRRLVRGPAAEGQPAVRPGDDLAAVCGRPGRGGGRLRRHRHRLGVPRHRPRQRRRPLAGRRPQRDPAAPGVPAPARRVRRDDREALPPDRRPPGRQRELERELGARSGLAHGRLDQPPHLRLPRLLGRVDGLQLPVLPRPEVARPSQGRS